MTEQLRYEGGMNTRLVSGLIPAALAVASFLSLAAQEPSAKKTLATGDAAPLFTLNNQKGQLVSLGAKPEGWTLIAFYPKALTGG